MNDTTLPIPASGDKKPRARAVKFGDASGTTTTSTSSSTSTIKKINPRKNIRTGQARVRKGFGLHDWKRLLQCSTDLAQRKGQPIRKDITPSEVAQHNQMHDGWTSLHGKVYNIGPYINYHPGGVDILKVSLGKDSSALFDKYHPWVNIENLIGPLLIGYLVKGAADEDDDEETDTKGKKSKGLYSIEE